MTGDKAVVGGNPVFLLTVPEEFGTVDVPSRQIAPSAFATIFVLYPNGTASGGRKVGVYGVVLECWFSHLPSLRKRSIPQENSTLRPSGTVPVFAPSARPRACQSPWYVNELWQTRPR